MSFTSPSFVLLVLAFVLLTNAFPTPRARSVVLAGASAVFIGSYLESPLEIAPIGAFLLFGYASIEALRRSRSRALLVASLLVLLVAFVTLKRYSFFAPAVRLPFPYLAVGLSYVLFRLIHLMVDAQQGELRERISALRFTNYCLSFLSFTAGPIQPYPEFAEQQQGVVAPTRTDVGAALTRLVMGFVKVGVVSAILNYVFVALSGRLLMPAGAPNGSSFLLWLASSVLYTGYLYANFAGYMDIVIAVGALAGLRLPENFNRPFAARNFLDFWSRWHMTLSSWFKTYLFNPLLKALAKRYPSGRVAPYLAVVAFFVTFLVMGVWHGSTSVFVVYGLLLGAGVSINQGWQIFAARRWGKKQYKQACERPLVVYLSRGLTFAYFALALGCLWLNLSELTTLVRRLGATGVLAGYATLASGAALSFAAWDALSASARRLGSFLPQPLPRELAQELSLAAQILLVLSVSSFFHKAPEFVYRAF
jgi:D-alanyl-lipoteichoic acid acyltransferase DltB (MBOAT superfamily)